MMKKSQLGFIIFTLVSLGFLFDPALAMKKAYTQPKINTQKAMHQFIHTLEQESLANLINQLPERAPKASHECLSILHQELRAPLFNQLVNIMSTDPAFLKRFLDTSISTIPVEGFSAIMTTLAQEPEAIKTVTTTSIMSLNEDDLIKINKTAAKYPKALKLFAINLPDDILAEFAKKTYEDRVAMKVMVESIQKNEARLKDLGSGIDLDEISKKILAQIDKSYFQKLITPENANREMSIQSLSLADGIIDVRGQEEISLRGMDRQALKMLDTKFFFAFVWNIYFGDKSSQLALKYRKKLRLADERDGEKNLRINLRQLAEIHPDYFDEIARDAAQLMSVARFQKQLSDPDIFLEPLAVFLKNHHAEVVADTFSPLFIRSLEIQPSIAKITLKELPPEVIGILLEQVVEYMGTTQEGRTALKRLTHAIWEGIDTQTLKEIVMQINQTEPQALYDLVVPVMIQLDASALAKITRNFTKHENVFYEFNTVALKHIPPEKLKVIANAITQDPKAFYVLSNRVVHTFNRQSHDAFFDRLSKNQAFPKTVHELVMALDEPLFSNLEKRFLQKKSALRFMMHNFPEAIVLQIAKSVEVRKTQKP